MRGLRTVTRPIAWGAALLSGLLLVYLGGVPLFFRLGLAPRFSLPPLLDLGVLAILSFLAGVVFARSLLRSLPVRADGRRRIVVIVILGVMLAPREATPEEKSFNAIGVAASSLLEYHKSWLRAVPGMLLGALGCVIAVLPVTAVALAASPAVVAQGPEAITWTTPAILWSGVGSAALFLRPALDRGTEKELKKRLRQTDADPPANSRCSESSL